MFLPYLAELHQVAGKDLDVGVDKRQPFGGGAVRPQVRGGAVPHVGCGIDEPCPYVRRQNANLSRISGPGVDDDHVVDARAIAEAVEEGG